MIMLLSSDYQILIQLIQREIWPDSSIGTKNAIDQDLMQQDKNIVRLLSDYSADRWMRLLKEAARQGLLAIAWDALEKLQAEHGGLCRGMSRETRIRWALSIKHIEKVHLRQREALKELAGIFAESGMRVMVLKGLGLADMYPRPEHRECGDLDIYLFGDFEKGNEVMRKMGIAVEYDGTKHSKFYYKGIPVENHKNFLNVTTTRVDKDLESELMQILQEQKCGSLDLGGITVDVPPPDFQMIFLTRHTITHFLASGLVLRHLYDFGIFYSAHAQEVDLDRIEKIFKRESQHKLYRAFLDVLHIYLGMPARKMKAGSSKGDKALRTHNHGIDNQAVDEIEQRANEEKQLVGQVQGNDNQAVERSRQRTKEEERLAARVLDDIIRNPAGGSHKVRLEDMWVPKRKFIGSVRLFRFRWKYQLVEKNAFGNRFWRAIGHCFRKSHG
jgi:hypothetical protein